MYSNKIKAYFYNQIKICTCFFHSLTCIVFYCQNMVSQIRNPSQIIWRNRESYFIKKKILPRYLPSFSAFLKKLNPRSFLLYPQKKFMKLITNILVSQLGHNRSKMSYSVYYTLNIVITFILLIEHSNYHFTYHQHAITNLSSLPVSALWTRIDFHLRFILAYHIIVSFHESRQFCTKCRNFFIFLTQHFLEHN